MFQERQTFPRFTVTHDLQYVRDYAKESSVSSETSLELTSKILVTMCLSNGQRSQILVSLYTDCVYLNNSECLYYISVIKNFTSKISSIVSRV